MPVYLGLNKVASAGGNVTTVCVDFSGCPDGTQYFLLGYGQYMSAISGYSIESPISEYMSYSPYGARNYIPVCLPPSSDNFTALILFTQAQYLDFNFVTSGNISSTAVVSLERIAESSWNSATMYGFAVSGSGAILVTPKS